MSITSDEIQFRFYIHSLLLQSCSHYTVTNCFYLIKILITLKMFQMKAADVNELYIIDYTNFCIISHFRENNGYELHIK
jgi:hypothetical protein